MSKKPKAKGATAGMGSVPQAVQVVKPTAEQKEQERKWRAQDALRTIQQATEMQKDPGLMRDVVKLANEQMRALSKVAGKGEMAKPNGKK